MTNRTIELDKHRGMAAQKATELRRLITEVAAERAKLQARQDELERFLTAAPALTWSEAVEKARYLLTLFATCSEAEDPRRQKLIADVLADFERLLEDSGQAGEVHPASAGFLSGPHNPEGNDYGERPEAREQGSKEAEDRG